MNLFYPAHDLALAKGVRHFTPPVAARRLEQDLAALAPLWQPADGAVPLPWGWNYNTCKMLTANGVNAEYLPSHADLETLRALSSRRTVIDVLKGLRQKGLTEVDLPQALTSTDELPAHGNFLLKAPWSSSGRGLCWSRVTPRAALVKRAAATLREMGCVLLEPEYDKVQDLAMLFYADRSGVRFVGYSMFETDAMGTYRNGLIASNEEMENRLSQWVPAAHLHAVAQCYASEVLPSLLAPLADRPYPIGYVGVDMMIYRTATGACLLHPCIEVNLRCTMGVVARLLCDKFVQPGASGTFRVDHAENGAQLQELRAQLTREHPQQCEGERWRTGYFPLTEIAAESQFMAGVVL